MLQTFNTRLFLLEVSFFNHFVSISLSFPSDFSSGWLSVFFLFLLAIFCFYICCLSLPFLLCVSFIDGLVSNFCLVFEMSFYFMLFLVLLVFLIFSVSFSVILVFFLVYYDFCFFPICYFPYDFLLFSLWH